MKKNKWMRLAALMLVLCLITTCTVSGTYAKYITSDSATDSARVAKWGVTATLRGSLFGPTYLGKSDGNKITNWAEHTETVSAFENTDVVAPGTRGDMLEYRIFGKPEVSSEVLFGEALDANGQDANLANATVTLVKNNYGVMVAVPYDLTNESIQGLYKTVDGKSFWAVAAGEALDDATYKYFKLQDVCENDINYRPIRYSVDTVDGSLAEAPLDKALDYLSTWFGTYGPFAPNEQIDTKGALNWTWVFEESPSADSIYAKYDKQDTILGDMIDVALGNTTSGSLARYVVLDVGGGYYETVKYAEVPVADGSANTVWVAYYKDDAPTCAYKTELVAGNTGELQPTVLAVLGESVNLSITVQQVD